MVTVELICDDVLAGLDSLEPNSVGLIVTSPPYNLGKKYDPDPASHPDQMDYYQYIEWTMEWIRHCYRVLERGGRLCINLPIDVNLKFDAGKKLQPCKVPMAGSITDEVVNGRLFQGWVYNTTILWLERNISKRTAWGSWLRALRPVGEHRGRGRPRSF
jgi:site-specific DNA-methyltransferase (adenine-specific)